MPPSLLGLCETSSRGLSAFRQGVAVVVVLATLERLNGLVAFYTDDGVLSTVALKDETEDNWLHAWLCVHGWRWGCA